MKERFKSVICADILIKKKEDDKEYILLMKRQNTGHNDGEFELPGGHLEEGEDLFECMIRETEEELKIVFKREELNLIYLLHHYSCERLNFIFEADLGDNIPQIGEPEKCLELIWVPINDVPDNTTEKVKLILTDIINKTTYNKL